MKPILLPYQKRWVEDRARFKAGMMSRQSGKTFAATLEVVDACFADLAAGRRESWLILSRGERQAKEALEEGVKRHCKAYEIAFNSFDYDFRGSEASYRAVEVELVNGAKITAVPANPDTARGFSRNLLLDEFAFHADSRGIWRACFPVITRRGLNLRVISTPNGKNNKFYEIMTAQAGVWSRHIVDIYQAVIEGLPVDPEEIRTALADEDAWAREYELKWLDEASAWLPYDLINSVEHEEAGQPDKYQGGFCYIGNDIARKKDLWAAAVFEEVGDVLWQRELVTLKGAKFSEQDAEMDRLFEKYKVARLLMDETGMGAKPVEDAKDRYGEHLVEGVTFTTASKLALATVGKQAFEDRKIRIPLADDALRRDLRKLRKIPTATGAPRFDAESDGEGHADRTWAIFLALYGSRTPRTLIEYSAAGMRREAEEAFEDADIGGGLIDAGAGFGVVTGGIDFNGF